jgi:hypothetical protein
MSLKPQSIPPVLKDTASIQHIPFPAAADPDGGDWLRRISPRQATRSQIFRRVPVDREGRGCFLTGNIRPVLPEPNCDLDKSDQVARDRHQESRPRVS